MARKGKIARFLLAFLISTTLVLQTISFLFIENRLESIILVCSIRVEANFIKSKLPKEKFLTFEALITPVRTFLFVYFARRSPLKSWKAGRCFHTTLETKGAKSTMELKSITSWILVAIPPEVLRPSRYISPARSPRHWKFYPPFFFFFLVRQTRSTAPSCSANDKRESMLIELNGFFIYLPTNRRNRRGVTVLAFNKRGFSSFCQLN